VERMAALEEEMVKVQQVRARGGTV
jgi:hypothetical protein